MKLGVATQDFSSDIFDENGHPVWGGAGWARLGQYLPLLPYETTHGVLVAHPREGEPFVCGIRPWSVSAYESSKKLSESGYDVHFPGWNDETNDQYGFDVVYLQRNMLDVLAQDIPKFKAAGQSIFNDLDDWFWGIDPSNRAFHLVNLPGEDLTSYRKVISVSTAVSVSTGYLADRIRPWCKAPIEVLPNTVDLDAFKKRVHRDATPVIGWAGSTSHRSRDLETMRGILSQLESAGCRIHHMGHANGAYTFQEATGVKLATASPMVGPIEYKNSLRFDIGIVPLRDMPFNHAKSNIKGLEYVAANIPFVAPAFGEYKKLHDDYGIGRIAKNPKQWIQHLKALMDPEVRENEAKSNREKAAVAFSIETGAIRLQAFIEAYK